MMHTWTAVMAVLFTSMMNMSAEAEGNREEQVWKDAEYMTVDRITDGSCIVESGGGTLHILRNIMPKGQIREGDVLEWRIDSESVERRLERAHARLERMQTMSIVELNF